MTLGCTVSLAGSQCAIAAVVKLDDANKQRSKGCVSDKSSINVGSGIRLEASTLTLRELYSTTTVASVLKVQ